MRVIDERKKAAYKDDMTVSTANALITAKNLDKLSLKARKLLYLAMSQCVERDNEFYEYEISASEFADIMGIKPNHVYQEAKTICEELIAGYVKAEIKPGKSFEMYSLFAKCKYDNGLINFKLNPDMTVFLLKLAKKGNFSKPLLQDFVRMKSTYAMAIWHLMQREMGSRKPYGGNIIEFDLDLAEIREATGTAEKQTYDKLSNFKTKVLDRAIKEINELCGVRISYTDIKRGRLVVAFHFVAVSRYKIGNVPEALEKKIRKAELLTKQGKGELTGAEYDELQTLILELDQLQLEGLDIEN